MILKANQKYIDMSCVRHLLAVGEKNADFLTFEVDKNYHEIDISECAFILRAVNSAGNLIEQTLKKRIENNSIFLTWTVDEYFTAVSGVLKLEIRGVKNDEIVIKYDLSDIIVRESAVGEGLPEIPDTSVIQGEKGDSGLSAYEIWLSLGNSGTESDFIASLKGEKGDAGERGLQGIQGEKGENGKDGVDGQNGKSAYETWLSLGNSGTESDFIMSLKGEKGDTGERGLRGEKGDTGERGLQGIQGEIGLTGEKGTEGIDGFSPIIEVFEDTENSYKLLITDKLNSFKTPNLKGLNGISGGEISVIIDSELSGISENPVQNKIISNEISGLKNQISNLNDLISEIQTGGGNLKITTLFDDSYYEKYKNSWNFKCSYWDDRVFSFDEVSAKNAAFCNEENGYSMRFSNSFGWSADVTAVCSENVEMNKKSILIIDYNCSSDGDGMMAEIISEPDLEFQKISEFEKIPAFYAVSTSYISANFKLISDFEKGNYYFRLKVNTTNPVFTIRKILIISGVILC